MQNVQTVKPQLHIYFNRINCFLICNIKVKNDDKTSRKINSNYWIKDIGILKWYF